MPTTELQEKGAPNIRSTRELDMVKRRKQGWTLAAIGAHYGLSRERIRQILERTGLNARKYNNPQRNK